MISDKSMIIVAFVAATMMLCSPAVALVTSEPDNMTTVNMGIYEENATQATIAERGFFADKVGATNGGKDYTTIELAKEAEDGLRVPVANLQAAGYADAAKDIIDGLKRQGTYTKSLETTTGRDVAAVQTMYEAGNGFTFHAKPYESAHYRGIVEIEVPEEIIVENGIVTEEHSYILTHDYGDVSRSGYGTAMRDDYSVVGDALEIGSRGEIDISSSRISQLGALLRLVEPMKDMVKPTVRYSEAVAMQDMEVAGGKFMVSADTMQEISDSDVAFLGITINRAELKAEIEKVLMIQEDERK